MIDLAQIHLCVIVNFMFVHFRLNINENVPHKNMFEFHKCINIVYI